MITVTITRSGGVAGLSRSWYVLLDPEGGQDLCSRTRGDDQPGRDRDRDRYIYRVRARGDVLVIPESRWDDGWRGVLARAEPGDPTSDPAADPADLGATSEDADPNAEPGAPVEDRGSTPPA